MIVVNNYTGMSIISHHHKNSNIYSFLITMYHWNGGTGIPGIIFKSSFSTNPNIFMV